MSMFYIVGIRIVTRGSGLDCQKIGPFQGVLASYILSQVPSIIYPHGLIGTRPVPELPLFRKGLAGPCQNNSTSKTSKIQGFLGTNLKNSDRKRKIDQGGRTKRRFDFLQMILKKISRQIGDGEPTPFFFDNFFLQKTKIKQSKNAGQSVLARTEGQQCKEAFAGQFWMGEIRVNLSLCVVRNLINF